MTAACVFVGPTLPARDVAAELDAMCLPPVAQGDVFRAVQRYRPKAIGIIDGFFGGAPAVWHKEILWTISEGIPVFGSASMGALRAAELHSFGMQGVGRIFEAYRDGQFEDDDEVAVIHGPAEMGYMTLSEPMVNIRETLSRARSEDILGSTSREALERFAKSLYFPERCWPTVLNGRVGLGIDPDEIARLKGWLKTGAVDLKRIDALAMLAAMRESAPEPHASFHFERTHFWTQLMSDPTPPATERQDDEAIDHRVLDEARLGSHAVFQNIRTRALLRLASDLLRSSEPESTTEPTAISEAVGAIRSTSGLYTRATLEAWLADNQLDSDAFQELATRQARLDRFSELATQSLPRYLLDELRLSGDYVKLAERARRKQARLGSHVAPRTELTGSERLALRFWFAERRLGRSGDTDVATILKATGFLDSAHLDRSLHLERLYLTLIAPTLDD